MTYEPSRRNLSAVLMMLNNIEEAKEGHNENPAAKAGHEAGKKILAMREAENPKILSDEQIEAQQKVTLKSGKEVVLFTFGHNYGPSLQPNFRSLTEIECIELCELNPDLPAEFMFIVNDKGLYFCYNDDITALVSLNPLDSLTKVMKSDNPMLQSDLPFWHHYICYLPQIKLTM